MANKIVLISDDSDFFDYIRPKLELRRSDELFLFNFDSIPEKIDFIDTALLIINSENSKEKTLDLLNIFKNSPAIVFTYNDDESYRRKCFRAGATDFLTILTPDSEFRARLLPALAISSLLEKNKFYRKALIKNGVLSPENEVFVDYSNILDNQLEEIKLTGKKAVFLAISPNDKNKFLLRPSLIEATILNNIRKNDILMNYATSKYFLILFDIELNSAEKLWEKISNQFPQKIFAGISKITNQKRQQLINEALNKLHEAINKDKNMIIPANQSLNGLKSKNSNTSPYSNFKMFKQDFAKKLEQVITPVFYHIQQKYSNSLINTILEHHINENYSAFYIKGKHSISSFKITCPGFSKVNIDITYQKDAENIDAKRITLEPEELEAGLLEGLLEQFVLEYNRGHNNDY